ncbi:MAG: DUF6600 domain-containing protein [Silvibacterium sp.]
MSVTATGFTVAQETTTAPAPPADVQPTLQEPAPATDIRAVRLSDVQGSVQVMNGSEVDFHQAELNMPVVQGMKLVTAEDGRAEIQFEDGSVARVTPNSSITLTELGRNPDGSTVTVVQTDSGLTYYELNGRAGQYTVRFGQNNVVPIDSSIFRVDLDNTPELAVTHGSVHITNNQSLAADVHTNQTVKFDQQSPDAYQLLESVAANSWDQWNSDRDEALAQIDENATEARGSTGNPDDPAWSDLDASGDWYNVPGYGMGWTPSGVGQDWDPYGLGAWGDYSGIGYTWISGYSWGWWPYHCGAWSWFDSFGWMWFPGNCGWGAAGGGAGWYPYGVIWTIPPGYRSPRRPRRIHHDPGHGPLPSRSLIAVNRGPQFTQQFRSVGGAQPAPRTFEYDGQNIAPVDKSLHPHQGGPLGEGFSSVVERTNPGMTIRRAYGGVQYRESGGTGRLVYQPSPTRTSTPPAFHGSRAAPVYHAPAAAPVFHASPAPAPAPAAASHPHR